MRGEEGQNEKIETYGYNFRSLSGVARVPCALGKEIFLRSLSKNYGV